MEQKENDTVELLKECNAGCKSATNSMEQVLGFLQEGKLKTLILKYNKDHIQLGDECHRLLNQENAEEKDPSMMAKTMSWLGTEMKMMMNSDDAKVADIMVEGCNMGIKSLEKYLNQYQAADSKSKGITKQLITLEENFRDELYEFL
ncbi:MAG: hypothetical protein IIT46_03545 [Lachnospiraceae bacterium]|jgi:hypothetical protein|nr:hypothetical protein [Lachnospiraceae bacterium]MBQ5558836.1 hypothetical protein [Lachnospiraceae bacterium]MCR4802031.1 hypothetical protein [Lachnospiraceae bacterium]